MALLKIARMGHPVLRQVAEPVVDPKAPEIRQLVKDMVDTLADVGGVGLAAPQVHVAKRVLVFSVPAERASGEAEEATEAVPLTTLINPEIEPLSDEMALGWEACLSVPDLMGLVPRYTGIRYHGLGLDGQVIEREARGFHARVVQHEADHLDGKLYPYRMPDLGRLIFQSELKHHRDVFKRQETENGQSEER